MQKRWITVFMILLFSVSFVRAEIALDGPIYNTFNLGDRLKLAATISYPNSLNGFLGVSLSCRNASFEYYFVPIELSANTAKREQITELLLQEGSLMGDCNVVVSLLNAVRQPLERAQSGKLLITNKLNMDVKLSKVNVVPGESFIVSGMVKNARGESINDGSVKLVLEDEFFTPIKNGAFGYEFKLANDHKSGKHIVEILAQDIRGNNARNMLEFNVEAVASRLENQFNEMIFKPGDIVNIKSVLYDQAGDLVGDDVLVKIFDADNRITTQRTISSGEEIEFTFPAYAKPGEWLVVSNSNGLESKSSLKMQEIEALDFVIDEQKVIVTNIGNILYKRPIEIFLGEDSRLSKQTSLKPGETAIIDLSKEDIPSGDYSVDVASGDTKKSFENVEVEHTGKNVGEALATMLPGTGYAVLGSGDDPKINPYYAALSAAGAGVAGYGGYYYVRKRRRGMEKIKTMQAKEAERLATEIKSKRVKQPYKYKSDADKERELIEYRDRLLANVEKEKKERELAEKRQMLDKYRTESSFRVNEPDEKKFDIIKDDVKDEVRYEEKKENDFGFSTSKNMEEKSEDEDFTISGEKKKKNDENLFGLFD